MTDIPVVWNVFVFNLNTRKIEIHNVFNHGSFLLYSAKWIKKYKDDREKLEKEIRRELTYYYWSRFEWEIIISNFSSKVDDEIKVDVYEQVRMNWDIFFDYFWEHRKDIIKQAEKFKKMLGR